MPAGNILQITLAAAAIFSTLFSMGALWWITRPWRSRKLPAYTPPVTIYKPLKGLDEGLEENLRSFFALDYPQYQLIFAVADPNDPAIPIVRKLMAEFPGVDAELVVGVPEFGLNPKVASLAAMERFCKHEAFLISDSNVRARPSYLRETACFLADRSVGLVTNIFAGVEETGPGGALENLQLNGFIAGGIACAKVTNQTCVVGKSMLMTRRALDAIGGFAAVRNLLAEDQVIGMKVRRAGYRIVLSPHIIDNVNHERGLRWFLNRHSRWYKIRRRLALPWFLFEPTANLAVIGLVWALSDDSGFGWGGLGVLIGLGIVRDALQSRWLRGSMPKLRHLALSPIKDLFLFPVWFDALVNNRIHWRGHKLLVGRYTRLRYARHDREEQRKRRRVRFGGPSSSSSSSPSRSD